MNVTYACPKCEQTSRCELSATTEQIACSHCDYAIRTPQEAVQGNSIQRCVICPGKELFVRKDFSQRLGITIIAIGFVLSSITWAYYQAIWTYIILGATAIIDLILYWKVKNLLQCYKCRAEYRGCSGLDEHHPFDLETHERYRQEAARRREAGLASSNMTPDKPASSSNS